MTDSMPDIPTFVALMVGLRRQPWEVLTDRNQGQYGVDFDNTLASVTPPERVVLTDTFWKTLKTLPHLQGNWEDGFLVAMKRTVFLLQDKKIESADIAATMRRLVKKELSYPTSPFLAWAKS